MKICWIFHKWGKWQDNGMITSKEFLDETLEKFLINGHYVIQLKYCSRCNKVKSRRVEL